MPNVTVVGASGTILTVPFTGSANYALAQQLAAIINAAGPAGISGGNGNLNDPAAGVQPTGGGLTEFSVTTGGAYSTGPGTNFLTDNASGAVTVQGSPFLNVIAGTGGLTFYGAASGNTSIAVGGGNNLIALPGGSYDAAFGPGSDTVYANGSGTVDASGGGGPNLIFAGQNAGTQNIVFSAGTGDTIVAGAGNVTVGETGSNSTIYLGTGSDMVADGGKGDTVEGSSAPIGQTVFGGDGGFVYGNGNTLTFVGGTNAATTVMGGVKDTLFGSSGSDISYFSGSTAATLAAGAGNETLNAAGSSQNDYLVGGTGNTTISLGSGADTLAFFNGKAGGTDVVSGFTSSDTLADVGYGGATPTVSSSGGNTTVVLGDGTKITLLNYSNTNFVKSS